MPPRGNWTRSDRLALLSIMEATGFRVSECRSLTPDSFNLRGGEPTVTVAAAYTKNRAKATQPIRLSLVGILGDWLEKKPPGQPVFPMGRNFSMAAMMRSLCRRAGVPYRDAEGFLDGHALRHSYATAIGGRTDIKTAQSLMRHSTVAMTARYMHTDDEKRRRAVEGK
jgi:integrase